MLTVTAFSTKSMTSSLNPPQSITSRTFCSRTSKLVSDLMGRGGVYGPGRIIIESCSTKIVLKQDQAASQVLKEAFNLSDGEEKFIVNAKIWQGYWSRPKE